MKLTSNQKQLVKEYAKSLFEETKNSIRYAVVSKDRQFIVNKSGNTNYLARYNGDINNIATNSKKSYWESWMSDKVNSIGVDLQRASLTRAEQDNIFKNRKDLFDIIEVKLSINL